MTRDLGSISLKLMCRKCYKECGINPSGLSFCCAAPMDQLIHSVDYTQWFMKLKKLMNNVGRLDDLVGIDHRLLRMKYYHKDTKPENTAVLLTLFGD